MSIDDLLKSQRILKELLDSPTSQLNRALSTERQLLRAFEETDSIRRAFDDATSILRHDPLSELRRSFGSSSAEIRFRSPTMTVLNEAKQAMEAVSGSWDTKVKQAMEGVNSSWDTTATLLSDLAHRYEAAIQAPASIAAEASRALTWWTELQSLQFQPLASLGRQVYVDLRASLERNKPPAPSFAGEVVTRLAAIERSEPEQRDASIAALTDWFTAEVAKQPKKAVSYMSLLSVMLAIVIFLYQEVRSSQSEARLTRQMAETEAQLLTAIQASRPDAPAILLVTTKRAHLRKGPSKASESLRLLGPNALLEQLQGREDNWVEVDYFDLETGDIQTGWVYRPLLRRVRQ